MGLLSFIFGELRKKNITVEPLNTWAEVHNISDTYKFNEENIKTVQKISFLDYKAADPNFKKIKHLPKEIGKLTKLEILKFGDVVEAPAMLCDLIELPPSIGNLSNLKELHLQYQSLERLPREICKLKNLRVLKLGGNELKELPYNIGDLSQLEILTVWANNIDSLPDSITNLKNLRGLDLSRNPIENKKLSRPIMNWLLYLKNNGCNIEFNNDDIDLFRVAMPENHSNLNDFNETQVSFYDDSESISDADSYDDEYYKSAALLDEFGVKFIYHMTHYRNLKSILKNGLLSHHNDLVLENIDNKEVNNRRNKIEPFFNENIQSYIPFYFNPKNPMLYANKEMQEDIVILAFSRELLLKTNTLFTNGNAAANRTKFYNDLSELNELNWDCLNTDYWSDFEYGKNERMAEVLVSNKVNIINLEKIYCYDQHTCQFIKDLDFTLDVEINKNFYF